MGLFDWFTDDKPSTTVTANADGTFTERKTVNGRTTTRTLVRKSDGKLVEDKPIQLVNEENLTAADRAKIAEQDRLDRKGSTKGTKKTAGGNSGGSSAGSSQPTVLDLSNAPSPSEESQPKLVNDVRQGSRFVRDGIGRPQVFDINSFRSELLENDVLPSHSYLVTFAPFRAGFEENAPLTRFVTNRRNTLVLRCENVVLPTSSLLEEENIRRYGYGPVEKVPYGVQFSDVTMTWLVDKRSEIVDFFHQWMNTIVMHDSQNTLMQGGQKRNGLRGYEAFEVGYKDAYSNPTVRIYVYNRQNQTVTTYEMYDVFPMNIQAMNLSWTDENQLQKLTITFAYTNMRVDAPLVVDESQLNFLESGRLPPFMERLERLNDTGGASADAVPSPGNEATVTTVNASSPNATEATPPPPAPPSTTPQPLIRNLTVA